MPLLEAQHVKKYFKTPGGDLHAVDDITFQLEAGKTLGLVGESGCGKSTLGRTLIHLLEPTDGKIIFNGEDITNPSKSQMLQLRQEMQIIFQDPFSSLDPRKSVSESIMEPLKLHRKDMSKADMLEETRKHPQLQLGVSPRGGLAVCRTAKAHAFLSGRDYVTPDDVSAVFRDVCAHRVLLSQKARMHEIPAEKVLTDILEQTKAPDRITIR